MSLSDFRIEFDRLVQQLKSYAIELPEVVLAYRAMKSANISPENEKIVRATVSEIKLTSLMNQLQKVVGIEKSSEINRNCDSIKIKTEPDVNYAHGIGDGELQVPEREEEACYTSRWFAGRWNQKRAQRRGRYGYRRGSGQQRVSRNRGSRKTNPLGPDGKPSTCLV